MSITEKKAKADIIRWWLGPVFLVLGTWLMIWPSSVMALAVRTEFQSYHPTTLLAFSYIGLQALVSGTLVLSTEFTKTTFFAFGVGLFPFFVFNLWVYVTRPMIAGLGLLDLVGNVFMLVLCWMGWLVAARKPSQTAKRDKPTSIFKWLFVAVFAMLGTFMLCYPSSVMGWIVLPEQQVYDDAALFALGAFGSQMLISALFGAFSHLKLDTPFMFALSTLPFCIFNVWYYFINPVLAPSGMLLILLIFSCFGFIMLFPFVIYLILMWMFLECMKGMTQKTEKRESS